MTRRSLFAGLSLEGVGFGLAACGRKLASRYPGFLYVARKDQRSVAVIDLEQFRWAGKIDLPSPPAQLVRAGNQLLAVCPQHSSIHAIDIQAQKASLPIRLPSAATGVMSVGDGSTAVAIGSFNGAVFQIDLRNRRITARAQLHAAPGSFDQLGDTLAISVPLQRSISFFHAKTLKLIMRSEVAVEPRTVRFRNDGKILFAGAWQERQIVALNAASGAVLTRLSLPISPERFCFNSDGGQMFVSGAGADVVAIVSPYQSEVDQTILAGRTPGEMTTTDKPGMLLVSNPGSGDLTIIDIDTRMLSASVHVGESPGQVLVTPNNEFVLVMNRKSGDVAVIRLKTVLDHKNKTKPLFTVIPVGAEPVSAVIMPHETA